jgi:hypothetical protein
VNLETLCYYERIHRIKITARADANLPRRGRPVHRRGIVSSNMTILNASFTCTTQQTGTATYTGFLTPYLLKRLR